MILCSGHLLAWALTLSFLPWSAWVAQWVERPTSAQVMISRFLGSSSVSGSVLTSRSLEPASDSVSPSLSLPLPRSRFVFISRNKH